MVTVAEWAKGALAGLAKGAPFSLSLTKLHYATVAMAAAEDHVPADSPENDIAEVSISKLSSFVAFQFECHVSLYCLNAVVLKLLSPS